MLNLSPELVQMATTIIIVLAIMAVIYTVLSSFLKSKSDVRHKTIVTNRNIGLSSNADSTLNARNSDQKRKEIQNKLKRQQKAKLSKKITIQQRLLQAGLGISTGTFYFASAGLGIFCAIGAILFGANLLVAGLVLFVGSLGLPRFIISRMKLKRQKKFLDEFPNAIDVIVRGVRSGLPLNDALKMIAEESSEPLRSEFLILINEQKIGIAIQEGLFRMNDRIQLSELNFLAIVITIQQTMGGNLSETLAGLSTIIRGRKKMRAKIDAMSTEAKSSAAIIGALPLLIMLGISAVEPGYMDPMFETTTGHLLLGGSAFWMLCGVLVMRQMINLKI
ncbi:MAG: type II secretion system F family protein [Rhizobiales bacterium]|nr:type II secretion system F family protein [Hyphomicrobiales bacterium]